LSWSNASRAPTCFERAIPNVAGVIDFGWNRDGTAYLVMVYVPGERLAAIILRDGGLDPRRACALLAQVLAGLAAVHAAGVVHADVTSANVLVQ
jgi:serine/threonine protein kinase